MGGGAAKRAMTTETKPHILLGDIEAKAATHAMDFEDKTTVLVAPVIPSPTVRAAGRSAYFLVIAGAEAGRMYKVDRAEMIIGRAQGAGVRIVDDGVSRQHARVECDSEGLVVLFDLNSTNGTYVNGDQIERRMLQDGDKIQIGTTTILKFSYQDSVEEDFLRKQYESATRDALTGCYNKKYFLDHLPTEIAFARRHQRPLSLALCDIDHFKRINDTHGHSGGDAVLKAVASAMGGTLRTEDTLARWGGEEFVVIMRNTSPEQAFIAAERVRRAVEHASPEFDGKAIAVTVSVGVATWRDELDSAPDGFVKAADAMLYEAKRKGRNRVEMASL